MIIRRLGLIGDVHAEDARLARVLEWFAGQQVDAIACTGDVADGRGCVDTSCRLLREANAVVVAGNHDRWLLADRVRHIPEAHRITKLDPASIDFLGGLPRTIEFDTLGGPLLLCHGVARNDLAKVWPGTPRSRIERSGLLDQLLVDARFRFLVNGHLHYRVLIDFPELLLMNAGALKGPYAGVSVMDFAGGCVTAWGFDANDRPSRIAEHSLAPTAGRRVWRNCQEFDGTWEPLALHT